MLADPRDLFTPGFDRPSWQPSHRPLGPVRVRRDHPLFGGKQPHVAALLGGNGLQSLCETAGGSLSYFRTHPSAEGLRRGYARMVADRVGSTDDGLASANVVSSIGPNGTAAKQSLFAIYQPFAYFGSFDEAEGRIRVGQCGFQFHPFFAAVDVGYWAGNGNIVYYKPPLKNAEANVMAMSIDNASNTILFNVNGVTSASLTGPLINIGLGVSEGDGQVLFAQADGGDNTYLNPNGYLFALFAGNGFLTQGQLDALVADPYRELLEPDHGANWYVLAAGQAPSGDITAEITGLLAAGQIGNGVIVVGYAVTGLNASGGIGSVLGNVSATETVATVVATGAIGSVTVPSAAEVGISGCVGGGEIGQILLRFDAIVALSPSMLTLELGAPWVRRSGWVPEALSSEDWIPADEPDGGWASSEPTDEGWAPASAGSADWSPVQTADGGWTQ
jgi:hypothetical protein